MNDPEQIKKDLFIALASDRFDGQRPIETLRWLKERRGEYV